MIGIDPIISKILDKIDQKISKNVVWMFFQKRKQRFLFDY